MEVVKNVIPLCSTINCYSLDSPISLGKSSAKKQFMWKKPNLSEIPFFSNTVKYITINMFYKYAALSTDHPYYCSWIETWGLPNSTASPVLTVLY